jgi:acyl dehydratase
MPDPDLSGFPLRARGHQFEDFADGQVFEHHWGRTLNEGDASLFATASLRFTPLYFNAEYARAHDHPGVVVDPLLVLCTVVGLSVEARSNSAVRCIPVTR